jgi:hypothetical protein
MTMYSKGRVDISSKTNWKERTYLIERRRGGGKMGEGRC